MNSRERFYAILERRAADRPASWIGVPSSEALKGLYRYYDVQSMYDLKQRVQDDIYAVEVPYQSEYASAVYAAFDWYGDGTVDSEERTLTAPGCFCETEDVQEIENFDWPDPEKYIDPEECRRRVEEAPEDKAVMGMLWSAHFQDTCAAFGMQQALVNMAADPKLYQAVDDKIMEFYLKANRIFYEATKGRLDAVLIGNDMGSQRGLMVSPEMLRRFVVPGCKKLTEQAHSYGVKVIYHSCGSIVDIIPDLIEARVDGIHPIQALAAGMQPELLKERFGSRISFCGGVDTQDLLVNGSEEEVRRKVRELAELFPTGLILSPSHEALLPDVPPANVNAMFDEVLRCGGTL